jgi:two-component system cell cycle sensor histidine kinase/response regulator CckA
MHSILVVDNEASVRKMVSQILRDAGYKVSTASDGKEALALAAKQTRIDVLVTDIVMPGMGGAELYAWLKSQCPDVRVIFISGYMEREPIEAGFLKKPFTPQALVEKVRDLLASSPAA